MSKFTQYKIITITAILIALACFFAKMTPHMQGFCYDFRRQTPGPPTEHFRPLQLIWLVISRLALVDSGAFSPSAIKTFI